jgi:hypothetical protein
MTAGRSLLSHKLRPQCSAQSQVGTDRALAGRAWGVLGTGDEGTGGRGSGSIFPHPVSIHSYPSRARFSQLDRKNETNGDILRPLFPSKRPRSDNRNVGNMCSPTSDPCYIARTMKRGHARQEVFLLAGAGALVVLSQEPEQAPRLGTRIGRLGPRAGSLLAPETQVSREGALSIPELWGQRRRSPLS